MKCANTSPLQKALSIAVAVNISVNNECVASAYEGNVFKCFLT